MTHDRVIDYKYIIVVVRMLVVEYIENTVVDVGCRLAPRLRFAHWRFAVGRVCTRSPHLIVRVRSMVCARRGYFTCLSPRYKEGAEGTASRASMSKDGHYRPQTVASNTSLSMQKAVCLCRWVAGATGYIARR